ncbi:DUF6763 family protein [Sulfuricaulis sp.]|jgi:hypothetical protein|uniref:DUF6763 family protein n=1 Tax=Sulfuricaulis sp. TaxID=2003553 RepID=UPI00355A2240
MPMYEEPVVGAFYEDEDGRSFEVIAFDENDGSIEIQYGDSTTNEIDLDDWYGLDLERLESDEEDEDELEETDASKPPDDDDDVDPDEDDDDSPDDDDE